MSRIPKRYANVPGLGHYFKNQKTADAPVSAPAQPVTPQTPAEEMPDYEGMKYAALLALLTPDEEDSLTDRKKGTLVAFLTEKWNKANG